MHRERRNQALFNFAPPWLASPPPPWRGCSPQPAQPGGELQPPAQLPVLPRPARSRQATRSCAACTITNGKALRDTLLHTPHKSRLLSPCPSLIAGQGYSQQPCAQPSDACAPAWVPSRCPSSAASRPRCSPAASHLRPLQLVLQGQHLAAQGVDIHMERLQLLPLDDALVPPHLLLASPGKCR